MTEVINDFLAGSSPLYFTFPMIQQISVKALAKAKNASAPKAKNYNVGVSKGGVSFKEAFAHFRKKGAKTFTWNGKKYTTELKK